MLSSMFSKRKNHNRIESKFFTTIHSKFIHTPSFIMVIGSLFLISLVTNMSNASTKDQHDQYVADLIENNRSSFGQCLLAKKEEAIRAGVSAQRAETEFSNMAFVPRVLELDRSQPEFVSTFSNYYSKRVNEWRINKGREKFAEHKEFLRSLTAKYGIPGHYLISFWGLETNYGGYKGKMSTLDSLATLACDQRRSGFFTNELILALKLMDEQGLSRDTMKGSWAGAMGHTQFMPTTYANYAIDGDNDGTIDLYNSEKDALASAANFLWKLGWKPGLRWGREVILPNDFDYTLANKKTMAISEWRKLGIKQANDRALPISEIDARLRVPAGHQGPAFLTYDNFNIIMRWNNSEFYAIAVGQLANQIAGGVGLVANLPQLENFRIADIANIQNKLNSLGYDVGAADGIMGPATREGIRQFQADNKLVADGFPSEQTISTILNN